VLTRGVNYSPDNDFNSTGLYPFLSFSYAKKTGVYMALYLSTKIFDIHCPEYAKSYPVEGIWAGFAKAKALMV
jgi:hypothetical protein